MANILNVHATYWVIRYVRQRNGLLVENMAGQSLCGKEKKKD